MIMDSSRYLFYIYLLVPTQGFLQNVSSTVHWERDLVNKIRIDREDDEL